MKKVYISLMLLAALFLNSCDYLDKEPDDQLTLESVFTKRETTEKFLYNVYSYMPEEWNQHDNNPWNGACDEGDYVYVRGVANINNGSWEPSNVPYNKWNTYYQGIRAATIFMQNVDKCTELAMKSEDLRVTYKTEARFLRALYYFFLVRQYGPVILLGDEVISHNEVNFNRPRNTYEECVNYVVSEFDAVAAELPIEQNTSWYGKPTKGAALAYKSRMLLYAASPLYNGNSEYASFENGEGKKLFNGTYDPEKWKKAADASKAVIDMAKYSLVDNGNPLDSYKAVFTDNWNSEIIFGRIYDGSHWDMHSLPRKLQGYGGVSATLALVDAFAMSNGKYPIKGYTDNGKTPIIDATSGYSESGTKSITYPSDKTPWTEDGPSMFADREPRLYASINWGGERWISLRNGELYYPQYFTNGDDGPSATAHDYPKSGIMMVKMSHPDNDLEHSVVKPRSWIMFRLAEVYLNYAEALNEYYGPGNPEILKYVNMIRKRAGVPNLEVVYPNVTTDKALMREMIQRERQVELCFENTRFFDTRRWKIAEVTENRPAYGLDISQMSYNASFYTRVKMEDRVFSKKHYLYPLAQSELERNTMLVQNPYW